mgnify:CR=1 FL=1
MIARSTVRDKEHQVGQAELRIEKKSSQSLSEGRLRSHSGFSNDPVEYAIASERYGFN